MVLGSSATLDLFAIWKETKMTQTTYIESDETTNKLLVKRFDPPAMSCTRVELRSPDTHISLWLTLDQVKDLQEKLIQALKELEPESTLATQTEIESLVLDPELDNYVIDSWTTT